ncbi:uncharacterized protein LOC108666933 [Hyalella azteca]|uniref:Uncharacterized protein LOC108666933 n=1 Tax=Hyalella azteca TaxID=294128 RepID=A0A8B7N6B6_HYAAZ|nr:uncharacterized protein LOC108666933 [Hyalella azteca]
MEANRNLKQSSNLAATSTATSATTHAAAVSSSKVNSITNGNILSVQAPSIYFAFASSSNVSNGKLIPTFLLSNASSLGNLSQAIWIPTAAVMPQTQDLGAVLPKITKSAQDSTTKPAMCSKLDATQCSLIESTQCAMSELAPSIVPDTAHPDPLPAELPQYTPSSTELPQSAPSSTELMQSAPSSTELPQSAPSTEMPQCSKMELLQIASTPSTRVRIPRINWKKAPRTVKKSWKRKSCKSPKISRTMRFILPKSEIQLHSSVTRDINVNSGRKTSLNLLSGTSMYSIPQSGKVGTNFTPSEEISSSSSSNSACAINSSILNSESKIISDPIKEEAFNSVQALVGPVLVASTCVTSSKSNLQSACSVPYAAAEAPHVLSSLPCSSTSLNASILVDAVAAGNHVDSSVAAHCDSSVNSSDVVDLNANELSQEFTFFRAVPPKPTINIETQVESTKYTKSMGTSNCHLGGKRRANRSRNNLDREPMYKPLMAMQTRAGIKNQACTKPSINTTTASTRRKVILVKSITEEKSTHSGLQGEFDAMLPGNIDASNNIDLAACGIEVDEPLHEAITNATKLMDGTNTLRISPQLMRKKNSRSILSSNMSSKIERDGEKIFTINSQEPLVEFNAGGNVAGIPEVAVNVKLSLTEVNLKNSQPSSSSGQRNIEDVGSKNPGSEVFVGGDGPTSGDGQNMGRTSKRILLCQVCGKLLHGVSSLKTHLLTHAPTKPYACDVCHRRFKRRTYLNQHALTHTNRRPHTCRVCQVTYRTRSQLMRHLKAHERVLDVYECKQCSRVFNSRFALNSHAKVHVEKVSSCCEICGEFFTSAKALKLHRLTHSECQHRCEVCGKRFAYLSLLQRHMVSHDNDEPRYSCKICPMKFFWETSLANHAKTHVPKKFKCTFCPMDFHSELKYTSHLKKHSNPKPHSCTLCPKKFAFTYQLNKHINSTHDLKSLFSLKTRKLRGEDVPGLLDGDVTGHPVSIRTKTCFQNATGEISNEGKNSDVSRCPEEKFVDGSLPELLSENHHIRAQEHNSSAGQSKKKNALCQPSTNISTTARSSTNASSIARNCVKAPINVGKVPAASRSAGARKNAEASNNSEANRSSVKKRVVTCKRTNTDNKFTAENKAELKHSRKMTAITSSNDENSVNATSDEEQIYKNAVRPTKQSLTPAPSLSSSVMPRLAYSRRSNALPKSCARRLSACGVSSFDSNGERSGPPPAYSFSSPQASTQSPKENLYPVTTPNFSSTSILSISSAPTPNFQSGPTTSNFSLPPTSNFISAPTTKYSSASTPNFSSAPTANFLSAPSSNFSLASSPLEHSDVNYFPEPSKGNSGVAKSSSRSSKFVHLACRDFFPIGSGEDRGSFTGQPHPHLLPASCDPYLHSSAFIKSPALLPSYMEDSFTHNPPDSPLNNLSPQYSPPDMYSPEYSSPAHLGPPHSPHQISNTAYNPRHNSTRQPYPPPPSYL